MHIYIDESGIFSNPANEANVASVVAALAVPTTKKKELFKQFKRLTHGWKDQKGEVKGRTLDEAQIASVIALLEKFDVLLQVAMVDLGWHKEEEVTKFKKEQADRLIENLTPQHHPDIIKQMTDIHAIFLSMPNQLFIQAMLMFLLIPRTLLHMIWYYARRIPEELQWFYWMVDAKEQSKTAYETAWSTALFPIMGSMSAENPVSFIEYGNYSYFNKFVKRDAELTRKIEAEKGLGDGDLISTNLWKIIGEHFSFQDSKFNVGLKMADILANATQRAMNRRLKLPGWKDIGRLMIHRSPNPIQFIGITPGPKDSEYTTVTSPFHKVFEIIHASGKSLWLDAEGEAALERLNHDADVPRMSRAKSLAVLDNLP